MAGETHVKRLTMFKIPKEEDIEKVLKEYEVLRSNAKRVGFRMTFDERWSLS